uniref:Uncharacterized protein n=1 Tax=Vespula pensylvanica TaxID=30213 RepID=A0A834P276_VESPE|nr:hypothetical protein H0235_007994 [Vespula pensylvanica]
MEGIKGQYTTTASARSRPKSKIKGTRNGWHIKRIASLAIESEGPRDGLSRRTSGTSIETTADAGNRPLTTARFTDNNTSAEITKWPGLLAFCRCNRFHRNINRPAVREMTNVRFTIGCLGLSALQIYGEWR